MALHPRLFPSRRAPAAGAETATGPHRQPRRTSPRLLTLVLVLGLLTVASARPLPVTFRNSYQAEIVGPDEGFPENSCSGIAPAPDGSLWMGTFRGLVRSNGRTYQHWGPPAMPHLARTGIINMFRDARGRTWFSTLAGLILHDGGVWRNFANDPAWGEIRDYARSYAEHPQHGLAIGRFSGGVVRFREGKFETLPAPPAASGGTFCAYDRAGTLYASRSGLAHVWRDGAWHPLDSGLPHGTPVLGLAQDLAGEALLIAPRHLVRFVDGVAQPPLALKEEVRSFWQPVIASDGFLWLPAVETGTYRVAPDGSVLHLRAIDGLPSGGGTRVVYPSSDGYLLIGSGVGGFSRLRPVRFRYLGRPEVIGEREIASLAPLPDGAVLIAPNGAELQRFDGLAPTRRAIPPLGRRGSAQVRSVLCAQDGTVWCGGVSAGLLNWKDGTLTPVSVPPLGADETVHTLFEDSRQRLWIAGDRTVVRRTGDQVDAIPLPPGPGFVYVAEGHDGAIYLARDHEVFVVREGTTPALLVRLNSSVRIGTLWADVGDRLWIGTLTDGLFVFHAGTVRGVSRTAGSVNALIGDAHGYLWFGGDRQIVRARPDDLWALALNPAAEPRLQIFDTDDGLRNLEFPFGSQPAVARDRQGRLWFALIRGATMIDPGALLVNERPPPVVFESVSYLQSGLDQPIARPLDSSQKRIELPAGSRSIRLEFAALDFAAPAKQRFLVELDGVAQSHAPQPESSITFFRLPPGDHTVAVRASGSDGVWNRTGATLQLFVRPFFWQTRWFQLLVATSLLGLIVGGAWFVSHRRIRHVRLQLAREQRLAAAQARLALVLENTTDFVLFTDAAGRLLFLNRAGRDLVGLAAGADLSEAQAAPLLAPFARDVFAREGLPSASRVGNWSGELALLHTDGREIPVSAVIVAHPDPAGGLEFAALIARDISSARRHGATQEALRGLATALTAALDPGALGQAVARACRELFQHDSFFLVLIENGSALTAFMEDTAEGASAPEPFPPLPRPLSPAMQPVLAGQSLLFQREADAADPGIEAFAPWGFSRRLSRSKMFVPIVRDRRTIGMISVQSYTPRRYREADLEQLRALADQCAAAIARMHAERQLRENEERLRLAMQAARMGSWEIDLESQTLLASPEAETIYGRPLGSDPLSLAASLADSHAAELRQLLAEALAGRISTLSHTQLALLPGGEQRWFEVKAHRQAHLDDTRRHRIIGVTADITARKRAELERARLEEQLRQSQKLESVGTLAGGIAHDFNNILTAILGNVELARLELGTEPPAGDFLDRIHESGLRARDLVRRLLAFSRPQARRRGATSLQAVIGEVTRLLRATIPATTELRVTLAPDVPAVEADSTEIHQVLLNLGTNAWQALGHRPGWISFTLDACTFGDDKPGPHNDLRPGRYARVRVQDNGPGIPPALLPRIFDPFFTTKAPGEGTGLGLSVAHGIMRACGGAILVESTVGVGTAFDLYFPAATAQAARVPLNNPVRPAPAPYAGRVLFVDDEEALLVVAERSLQRAGFEVTACLRPTEALARFRAAPQAFDIVLTDLAMPEMSGVALTQQILALRPEIPVLIASGYIPAAQAAEARRAGARAVVDKIEAFSVLPTILSEHLGPRPPTQP